MSEDVRPRNRTALAAAIGNPASARLDSAVANCFPGLELDTRALEGRFFPGLLFWIVSAPVAPVPGVPANQQGIRLKYLDYELDPMLPERSSEGWVQELLTAYRGAAGLALSEGRWYLHWLEQGGKRIACEDAEGTPYGGGLIWRFIRCLSPAEPLTIALIRRGQQGAPAVIELKGRRRRYTTNEGIVDLAFPPGELTGAMCNPWQHDFRDCACYYWASNHPDVVLGESSGRSSPDESTSHSPESLLLLDWLRRDRSPAGTVGAPASRAAARPYQLDHYEINHRWQELSFVIAGREVDSVYEPPDTGLAQPYSSTEEMISDLRGRLAPLELTLAYQYLYAVFSLRDPAHERPDLAADITMARQFVTMVAVSEMTHLRWANQILWELKRAHLCPTYEPVLTPLVAPIVIAGVQVGRLRPMDLTALEEFARIERPGGPLDTAYARCVATLSDVKYPPKLRDLAIRIDTDGAQHYARFRQVRVALESYRDPKSGALPYLREIRTGSADEARQALVLQAELIRALHAAYNAEGNEQYDQAQHLIFASREIMDRLRLEAEALATQGIGIPFFSDEP